MTTEIATLADGKVVRLYRRAAQIPDWPAETAQEAAQRMFLSEELRVEHTTSPEQVRAVALLRRNRARRGETRQAA